MMIQSDLQPSSLRGLKKSCLEEGRSVTCAPQPASCRSQQLGQREQKKSLGNLTKLIWRYSSSIGRCHRWEGDGEKTHTEIWKETYMHVHVFASVPFDKMAITVLFSSVCAIDSAQYICAFFFRITCGVKWPTFRAA